MNSTNQIGWQNYYETGIDTPWKDEVDAFLLENKSLFEGMTSLQLLDVACGDGRNLYFWDNPNIQVCAVDISAIPLQKVKQRALAKGFSKPLLIGNDFLELDLSANEFDIVTCFDGLSQIDNIKLAIIKLCSSSKIGGFVLFNVLTKEDCAYGEGEKIDDNTYIYKNTLFKFMSIEEIKEFIPVGLGIVKSEVRVWNDPPHGDFRPYPHTHSAAYFLIERKI